MQGLTSALLGRACRVFLSIAYPDGGPDVPPPAKALLDLGPDRPLADLLRPPLCETLPAPGGSVRGYAFRLGSAAYPHLKLQATDAGGGTWVFAVDTHDTAHLHPDHPQEPRWAQLQLANRQLKEQIERAWEAEGLLTFNGLLRRELDRGLVPK